MAKQSGISNAKDQEKNRHAIIQIARIIGNQGTRYRKFKAEIHGTRY